MIEGSLDMPMRAAAFQRLQDLQQVYGHLTAKELKPGFEFQGKRIPLVNPQRGIFKPKQMRFLLSIRTVFPRPGGKVWYDDQRKVHSQIYGSDESVDYAFMGNNPDAADNRWLREAFENRTPAIYFLGIAPRRYQAMFPVFISGWDAGALKATVAFGLPAQAGVIHQASFSQALFGTYPASPLERRYALQYRSSAVCISHHFARPSSTPMAVAARFREYRSHCAWTRRTSSLTSTKNWASQ